MAEIDLVKFNERMAEVKQEVAAKCADDSAFRASLIANPSAAIEKEYGLPAGCFKDTNFRVVEEGSDEIMIPIPPNTEDMELSAQQLEAVAGGVAFGASVAAATFAGIAVGVSVVAAGATVAQGTRAGREW